MGKHRGTFEFSDQALPGQKVCTNRTESRGFSVHRDHTEVQIHHHQ